MEVASSSLPERLAHIVFKSQTHFYRAAIGCRKLSEPRHKKLRECLHVTAVEAYVQQEYLFSADPIPLNPGPIKVCCLLWSVSIV